MSRAVANFFLDATLLVVFLALLWVSVVLQFLFPPGPSAAGWTLWGWDFGQWQAVEFALVALLTLGILVHVMLHWTWVCGLVASRFGHGKGKPDDGTRTLYGVGLLIVLLHVVGLAVGAAALGIRAPN